MFKKWHKVVLIVFLFVVVAYFLVYGSLTVYFLTKPYNRVGNNFIRLLGGLFFTAIIPLILCLFTLKRKKVITLCIGVLAFLYFTLYFFIPNSMYWIVVKHFLNLLPPNHTLVMSGIDWLYYLSHVIAVPLLYLFTIFSLYLAIFKLKNQRKRPVKPV